MGKANANSLSGALKTIKRNHKRNESKDDESWLKASNISPFESKKKTSKKCQSTESSLILSRCILAASGRTCVQVWRDQCEIHPGTSAGFAGQGCT
jgi:hypothetical protein